MKNIDGNSSESISNTHSPKYIYMKTSGGLWHFLKCIGSVIDIAKKSKREIIIDTKNLSVYYCNFSKIFDIIDPILKCDEKLIDKCKNEFKPYLNIDDINKTAPEKSKSDGLSYLIRNMKLKPFSFKEYENQILTNLSKTKIIILYSGNNVGCLNNFIKCINYIKINKDTRKVVEDLYKSLPEKYIGIHYRNREDLISNFDNVCKSLQSIIDKNNCYNVFIATDTYYIINEFEVKFPECKFYYNKKLNFENLKNKSHSIGLHYIPPIYFKQNNIEKYFLHQNYIADIYCVINSIDYITTLGNNRLVIPMFRKNKELKKKFFRDDK